MQFWSGTIKVEQSYIEHAQYLLGADAKTFVHIWKIQNAGARISKISDQVCKCGCEINCQEMPKEPACQ